MNMFCYQCQETAGGSGCTKVGGCVANLQDLLLYILKGYSSLNAIARANGLNKEENEDIRSLRELITYGVKGMAAYAEHAMNLKQSKKAQ